MNDNILYHALAALSILRAFGLPPPLRAPRPAPPFPLVSSVPLRIGPERSRARSGEADP